MAVNNNALRSDEILASMVTVSSTIPRKVRHVVGPLTFSVLMGASNLLQRDNISDKF